MNSKRSYTTPNNGLNIIRRIKPLQQLTCYNLFLNTLLWSRIVLVSSLLYNSYLLFVQHGTTSVYRQTFNSSCLFMMHVHKKLAAQQTNVHLLHHRIEFEIFSRFALCYNALSTPNSSNVVFCSIYK